MELSDHEKLELEVRQLREKLAALEAEGLASDRVLCAYCQELVAMASVQAHIVGCPRHPVAKLSARIEVLDAEARRLRECLAKAALPLEVLMCSDADAPICGIGPDLRSELREAVAMVRDALGVRLRKPAPDPSLPVVETRLEGPALAAGWALVVAGCFKDALSAGAAMIRGEVRLNGELIRNPSTKLGAGEYVIHVTRAQMSGDPGTWDRAKLVLLP